MPVMKSVGVFIQQAHAPTRTLSCLLPLKLEGQGVIPLRV